MPTKAAIGPVCEWCRKEIERGRFCSVAHRDRAAAAEAERRARGVVPEDEQPKRRRRR